MTANYIKFGFKRILIEWTVIARSDATKQSPGINDEVNTTIYLDFTGKRVDLLLNNLTFT
jgi:hypothetical protein